VAARGRGNAVRQKPNLGAPSGATGRASGSRAADRARAARRGGAGRRAILAGRQWRRKHEPKPRAARTIAPMSGSLVLVAFAVEDRQLALELGVVERVLPMAAVTPLPRAPAVVLGALNIAGVIVPVFDVRRRLGLPERGYGPDASLVLARTSRRAVAIPADQVHGVRAVDPAAVTSAEALAPGIDHIAGAVALEDDLLLIQDLDAFLTAEEERVLAPALAEAGDGHR
jgi:purine-binding chemotaxis protein CheW